MIEYLTANLWQLWIVIAVACLILELSSGTFYILCFAVGAVVAALAYPLGGFVFQVIVFAVVSAVSIFLVRPFAMRYLHENKPMPVSNADAIIGRVGRVSETIIAGRFGRVAIDGDDWKAQASAVQEDIPVGTLVKVLSRESIIIDVEPATKEEQ